MSIYTDYIKKHCMAFPNSCIEVEDFMQSCVRNLYTIRKRLSNPTLAPEMREHLKESREHHEKVLEGSKELYFSKYKRDAEQYVIVCRRNIRNNDPEYKETEYITAKREVFLAFDASQITQLMQEFIPSLYQLNEDILKSGDDENRRAVCESVREDTEIRIRIFRRSL